MISSFEQELKENGFFVYKNVGSSMKPIIRQDRDLLVIKRRSKHLKKNDVILYKRKNNYILHRLIKIKNDKYYIRGDNCIITETDITDKDIIGILYSIERKNKSVKMDSNLMKIYAFVWNKIFFIRFCYWKTKRFLWKIKKNLFRNNK